MADFCFDCVQDLGVPAGKNDLAGLCDPDEVAMALCEGCGVHWFNSRGQLVDPANPRTEGEWVETYEDRREETRT